MDMDMDMDIITEMIKTNFEELNFAKDFDKDKHIGLLCIALLRSVSPNNILLIEKADELKSPQFVEYVDGKWKIYETTNTAIEIEIRWSNKYRGRRRQEKKQIIEAFNTGLRWLGTRD